MNKLIIILMLLLYTPVNAMMRSRPPTRSASGSFPTLVARICTAARRTIAPFSSCVLNNEQRKLLDQNLPEVLDRMYHPRHHSMIGLHQVGGTTRAFEFPWLPGCMIKTQEQPGSRLAGALKLYNSIKNRNSHLLELPVQEEYPVPPEIRKKHLYNVPECIIVAKKIIGIHEGILNLEQAQQMKLLLEDTYYYDCSSRNLVHTLNKTIGLIDTELRGFSPMNNYAHGLRILLDHNKFTHDAQRYLEQELGKSTKK